MASPIPQPILASNPLQQPMQPPPVGGILLNGADSPPLAPPGKGYGQRGRPAAIQIVPPSSSPEASPTDTSFNGNGPASSPRIRFAPLPDPHRPRSLSTGRNLGLRAGEGPNGEREYSFQLQNMGDDDHAVEDDSESDYSSNGYEGGRRRSWVPSMGAMGMGNMASKMSMGSVGSWVGKSSSKKGKKEDEMGGPLKKTNSHGMIPTSPFKIPGSDLGSKVSSSLLGTSPGSSLFGGGRGSISGPSTAAANAAHRRGGSGDMGAPKVRMLNGRVYGARRASEAAAAEEMRRRQMEPDFVEWGNAEKGIGSSMARKATVDDDDGGGMAWVRKRREERERREKEEREAQERAEQEGTGVEGAAGPTNGVTVEGDDDGRPASLSSTASSSSGAAPAVGPLTPHEPPAELVGYAPTIEVTPPPKQSLEPPSNFMPRHPQPTPPGENDHVVHAIAIPGGRRAARHQNEDDDEEEDDGDFDDDDEEEDDFDASRFTSSAAGVEILSRHRK